MTGVKKFFHGHISNGIFDPKTETEDVMHSDSN